MFRAVSINRIISFCLLALAVCFSSFQTSYAQSQALNGQIEGVVTDTAGAAVPNASITVRNIEKGSEIRVISDESGIYKAPLLPLGTYRITVEAPNFKRLVREGITLSAGQIATANLTLDPGDVSATVTVTADAAIADPGKIDVGRVMNTREVQNLPLVSRNPYNYSLLQANVTGRTNNEFGVPRVNANGYARRTNYQLDGNNNTQADRAGIRLMPISETFVSEVQLVTNGFAPEFGNTPGLIMNAITPSGTNGIHGSASYRFRRTSFSSRPFNISPSATKPETKVDDFAAAVGGPIVKDRWHYYGGYEYVTRDLASQRVLTITEANKQALISAGVPSDAFPTAIPASQKVNFYIFRTDAQLTDQHRLTVRYNYFKNLSPNNIGGGLTTLQRSVDFNDVSYSPAVQLVSVFSPKFLNEFRFQYAKRNSQFLPNDNSGTGPSIVISGVANFGAPEDANTVSPLETTTQFLDNLTISEGNHTMKFGGGFIKIDDTRRSGVFARYTFPTLQAYLDAKSGVNPRGYTEFRQTFGDPNLDYNSVFYNAFAQDDWKATRRLKINYGVRYDLYRIPDADPNAPFFASQKFNVDKNNFAPRLGIVYGWRQGDYPTVIRASAGVYYDPPSLDVYQRAIKNNGNPTYYNVIYSNPATNPAAPNFPNTVSTATAPIQSIDTVAPDFKTMYAIHSNIQIEQGLTKDISITFGYIHSGGRHIPVYRSINRTTVVGTLADGRPIFSSSSLFDPRFNNILVAESVGNSDYNAGTLQLNKRFSKGYQFSINYTLSHSIDDAPEQNLVAASSLVLSDPTNRRRDRGNSLADQRHTFVATFVGRPTFNFDSKTLNYILNNNQISMIATANSGETFNIVSNRDLNNDGVSGSDRPLYIGRNTGVTPNQYNVDLRYSRFIPFTERFKFEIFGEFSNLFNTNSIFSVNSTLTTDAAGNVIGGLPTDFTTRNPSSLDSRQFQMGLKFVF